MISTRRPSRSEYLTEEQANEYIKRGDALECEIHTVAPRGHKEVILQVAQAIVDHIKSVPAADVVEVRHGRWIGKTYKCSLCGKWVDPLQGDADMNYCPNCGAKMDGEEQEHE